MYPLSSITLPYSRSQVFSTQFIFFSSRTYHSQDNKFTPQKIANASLTSEMCSFVSMPMSFQILFTKMGLNPNGLIIKDLEGSPWYFTYNYPILGLGIVDSDPSKTNGEKHFIGKVSINDEGKVVITDYSEGQNGFS
ncbi:MAG: hypothetical protein LBG24_02615 [Treponema sp.]|jgi:hypothetical protein|nr:hypothetical protein [Treponema sp.]